eukprot:TRINITY_DN4008_c0_g1_i2.p3 TRINITY_DN4008_c0_g1~~TRINITY_DN4008_c0_g1_i2.p3  ORF type:complete len:141 (+),score=61.15 TRINITY_DN4008_c0_g1_i2:1358-1780(+)
MALLLVRLRMIPVTRPVVVRAMVLMRRAAAADLDFAPTAATVRMLWMVACRLAAAAVEGTLRDAAVWAIALKLRRVDGLLEGEEQLRRVLDGDVDVGDDEVAAEEERMIDLFAARGPAHLAAMAAPGAPAGAAEPAADAE